MSLFWRIFALNAVVLGTATALLLWTPVTVSVPVVLAEAVILVGGLVVMLVANAALLRLGLAPLDRLTKLMADVDLLRPGQRLPVQGGGEVAEVIRTFNAMLERLEEERVTGSARVLLAQEGERRRIAQELHDEVGQSMTAVLLGLKRAADDAPEPLRTDLQEMQEATRESLNEVRRLVRHLRPGVLDDLGLVSALTSLAQDFATHTGLQVTRRFDAALPALDPETELALYRVAQESLTNAARHADAERVVVALRHTEDGVVLAVTDDGRGITAPREGAGIRGMRERALFVGGGLEITPAPRTGDADSRTGGQVAGSGAPASRTGGRVAGSGAPASRTGAHVAPSGATASRTGTQATAAAAPAPRTGTQVTLTVPVPRKQS